MKETLLEKKSFESGRHCVLSFIKLWISFQLGGGCGRDNIGCTAQQKHSTNSLQDHKSKQIPETNSLQCLQVPQQWQGHYSPWISGWVRDSQEIRPGGVHENKKGKTRIAVSINQMGKKHNWKEKTNKKNPQNKTNQTPPPPQKKPIHPTRKK